MAARSCDAVHRHLGVAPGFGTPWPVNSVGRFARNSRLASQPGLGVPAFEPTPEPR